MTGAMDLLKNGRVPEAPQPPSQPEAPAVPPVAQAPVAQAPSGPPMPHAPVPSSRRVSRTSPPPPVPPQVSDVQETIYATNRVEEREIYRIGKTTRFMLRFVVGGSVIIAVASWVMLATLFPLKTKETLYVVIHDNGDAPHVVSTKDAAMSFTEADRHAALRAYIEYREGYLPEIRDIMESRVRAMSAPAERARFYEWFQEKKGRDLNPKSPINIYGADGWVRIQEFHFPRSPDDVSDTKPATYVYHIRFKRTDSQHTESMRWVAIIKCQFVPEQMSTEDVLSINPYGLQVLDYKSEVDPE
jgi:type IV secretory pathway component VirB8